ncbi:MAG: FAD-dependent oxidoreductase [Microthrixaceae bacterium]
MGASVAGVCAAAELRRAGFEGDLLLLDRSPTAPADPPPLSKEHLAGTMSSGQAVARLWDRLDGIEVSLRLGTTATGLRIPFRGDAHAAAGGPVPPVDAAHDGRSIELDVLDADGSARTVVLDGVVIATGSSPRWPEGMAPTSRPSGVHVIRELADSVRLREDLEHGPRHVVVVGAGFIGAEVAATARAGGHEVTMVEAAPLPMSRAVGPLVGRWVADLHREQGVDVRLGVTVLDVEVDSGGALCAVVLSDGTRIDATVAVFGLGAAPELGWLNGSGLVVRDGVVCDETLSAAHGVVAAGDVARWQHRLFGEEMRVEHWENAIEQGEHAARRLLGRTEPFTSVPWFWSDQYGHKIQLAGRPRGDDQVQVIRGDPTSRRFCVAFRRGDRCTGVFGVDQPVPVVRARTKMASSLDWSDVWPSEGGEK